jgi:hypothetical protein
MRTKKFIQTLQVLRQGSISVLLIGGVFYVNHFAGGVALLTAGGLSLAVHSFLRAFTPIHEEPNWELVYPELALGHHAFDTNENGVITAKKDEL